MADWRKVMFCDESTSRLARGEYKLVRIDIQESLNMTPGTTTRR